MNKCNKTQNIGDMLNTVDCIADEIGWVKKGGNVLRESFKDTVTFHMRNPKKWEQCEEETKEYRMSNKKMLIKSQNARSLCPKSTVGANSH